MSAEERRQLRDRFRDVLLEAATQRGRREQIVQSPDGLFEAAWAEYERDQLLLAVNAERSRRGLPATTRDDIRHADRQAAGHVDYADKISLYCAEIAMGIERTTY